MWFSVEKELPPDWKWVWLLNDGVVVLGWYFDGNYYSEKGNTLLKNVTMWAKLEPPKL